MTDERYMLRALELAWRGCFTTTPNPNVGCVIVCKGKIIGEGWHQRAGEPHAELHALQMTGNKAKGATVYVTLEPCSHHGLVPPCCDALINAGVSHVVVAMQDPNPQVAGRGLYRLQQAGIKVSHGMMMHSAEALNRGFLKRMRTGLPWIQLKLGASLDGGTAMANGESQWITSPAARQDVQRLRAQSSAILTSSATVLADNPSLTVRWNELDETVQQQLDRYQLRQPVRVVIDSQQRVTLQHRLIGQPGETWLMRSQLDKQSWPNNAIQITVPQRGEYLDLMSMMVLLGQRQVNSICVEAGPRLSGALLQAKLVDEMIIYLSPKILGSTAHSLCVLPGLEQLADAPEFNFSDIRKVGKDLRLTLTPC